MRLETYLSTQPPAPGKNTRLSHSHEDSGGAQCFAAAPSEEPLSLDPLKSLFDLSGFPQDFSAATPKRVSAGLRRRAAPQRLTMHGLLPAQWVAAFTPGHHHASASGECRAPQSPAPAGARSVPAEPGEPSGRMGFAGEPARSGGESPLRNPSAGTAEAISPATPGVGHRVGSRLQVTGDRLQETGDGLPTTGHREQSIGESEREDSGLRPVTSDLSPVTYRPSPVTYAVLSLIRFYQACLSPVMPSACRFHPSCSAYAYEAVEQWGVCRGGRLALARLLRCHPWSGSYGYDPVPERPGEAEAK